MPNRKKNLEKKLKRKIWGKLKESKKYKETLSLKK